MEKEYTEIRKRDLLRDFQINIGALLLVTLTVVVGYIVRSSYSTFAAALITVGVLAVIYCIGRYFSKYVQYFTLAALLAYNIYRLCFLHIEYDKVRKINMFSGGYTYAVFQMTLISRIAKFQHKIIAMVFLFLLRFMVIIFWIDSQASQPDLILRNVIIDVFILYTFYVTEKSERKVFKDFSENAEELLKFKELLAQSLPQSVTILKERSNLRLFENKTFLDIFSSQLNDSNLLNNVDTILTQGPQNDNERFKIPFSLLKVDLSTIREVGTLKSGFSPIFLAHGSMYLFEIINELVKGCHLEERTVSLAATYSNEDQRRTFEVVVKKIIWNRENATAVILNDITYQENMIALKVANVNKDKILATVSHELRTPLHGIIGLISMAEENVQNIQALEYLKLGKDNAYLLLGLVNSILDFHQIGQGTLRLTPSMINLAKIIENVTQLFRYQVEKKKIFLNFSIDKGVPAEIMTDKSRLKQILINLIGNAIKFTRVGGVKIHVYQDKLDSECLGISVTDTGIGIKEEDREKIFRMNGRLNNEPAVNKNGVGIGLTTSNALAVLIGSKSGPKGIQVESKYGEGSTFTFKVLKDLSAETQIEIQSHHDNRVKDRNPAPFDQEEQQIVAIGEKMQRYIELDQDFNDNVTSRYFDESLASIQIDLKVANYISRRKLNTNDLNLQDKKPNKDFLHFPASEQGQKSSQTIQNFPSKQTHLELHENLGTINLSDEKLLQITNSNCQTSSTNKGDVLIVDDNTFNLLVAEKLMKDFGLNVKTAIGGHEAIEILRACFARGEDIKAILMDCQMPVMDGYETTRVLKDMMAKNEIQNIPIIAWTANNTDEDVKRCYESGMVDYLPKPTSKEAVAEAFAKLEKK